MATHEVAYYERIARETGATVVLLHHTNKLSRSGIQDGQQAYRGVTALFDNTRACWYLRSLTSKEILEEEINPEEEDKYFLLENAKNNYIPKHKNLIIKRDGYQYSARYALPKQSKEQKIDSKRQALIDLLLMYIQNSKQIEHSQAELLKWGRTEKIGRSRMMDALEIAVEDGLLISKSEGKVKLYSLTDFGKKYNLEID